MEIIKNMDDMDAEILRLESLRDSQTSGLKNSLNKIYENSKPINLIKNTLKDVSESQDIRNTILSTGVSLASAYFTKKILWSNSSKPKKILGSALMLLSSEMINNHHESLQKLKLSVLNLISTFVKKKKKGDTESESHH